MDFRILGPVEAHTEGRALQVSGGRQRAMLAVLLLRAGEPVPRKSLIEDLWGQRPPDRAEKTVQAVVSRLRRALGAEAGRLVTSAAGYRLRVEADELDLARFERLSDEGRRALAGGRPERAAGRLRAALQEWRGPPLADVAFEPFAPPEIARLEGLRAAAVEDRVEADLALGRDAELVAELEQLVAAEPLRERLRAQLMLALYRSGRQGEALDAYRDAVRTLDAELGLKPGPELERLQQAILAHDPVLLPTRPTEAPPPRERRRATATILCAELVGFTAALADADRVRRGYDGRARDALAAHGATAVTAIGDGLLATFPAAGAAIAGAIELQRAVARLARHEHIALELCVGVGAGDVTWPGDGPSGTPVVEAQLLCGAAPAGGILVAETVRLLAGSGTDVRFDEVGELELRGLQPVRAWSVSWSAQFTVAVPFPASLAIDGSPVFAGREPELAALRAAWDDAVRARRRGVFVSGEPGIGKTRLATEIAGHAFEREGVVLYGRCDDGLAPAAQPFAQALGAYVAACPVDELRVQLDGRGSELIALLPDLAERVPGLGEPAPAEPDVERLRMLDATGALLAAASAAAPVLLVLDDMHWADELSLVLLRHLLRTEVGMRLLVLATYRDTEPSRSPLLADLVTGLARRPDVTRLELGPLDEPDIATILEHAGRRPVLAAQVRAATEGNPFFVREMVEALSDDDPAAGAPLTPRVRDIVRWRLGRLPQPAADVLAVAAVIGAEFDVDVLADALATDPASALAALEAAEHARLVRPTGDLDRFTFTHALVRDAIADELAAGRLMRLHARIAHALEHAATTRGVAAGDLAAHFDAAGSLVDAAATLRHARAAGVEAAARFAFDVAAEQYERAVRAHARLPSGEEHERLDLELERGRALSLAGDETADAVLRRIATAAEGAGDGRRMADALLTLRLDYADHLEEDSEMVTLLHRALALLPHGDSAIRARLEGFLAQEAFSTMPETERRATVRRALAMARRAGDPVALASVLTAHCWIVAGPESLSERLAIADELVAGGRAADLPYAECDGQQWRFLACVERGDVKAADAALTAAHAAARTTKSQWTVGFLDAARALLAGRLADAEAAAARSREAAQETLAPSALEESAFIRLLSCIRLVQGRLSEHEQARRTMGEGLADPPATFFVVRAHVARERRDRGDARDAFDGALARGLLELPHGPTWMITLTWAADICAWLGDRSTATRLIELLEPFASVMTWQYGPVGRGVALLDLALGRRDRAVRRLREAIALCERMDAQAFLAMARHDLGTLLHPSPEGRRLLGEARASAERIGLRSLRVDTGSG